MKTGTCRENSAGYVCTEKNKALKSNLQGLVFFMYRLVGVQGHVAE